MNIGELSRLTGLPVKTIRYYSDVGLVPSASRSAANYRRYDHDSLVRLEYVRTLRELGLDIATIKRVLDRGAGGVSLATVAAAHAEAIGVQIRVLRLRRAALRAVARRDPSPAELDRMTRIAQAGTEERRRIIDEFFDSIFTGLPATPAATEFATRLRSVSADLPDDPTDEQVDAWIELAEMVREPDFRQRLRTMGERSFGPGGPGITPTSPGELAWFTDFVGAAMDTGSPPAEAVVATVLSRWAADTPELRAALLEQLTLAVDPRAERYWQLLAVINGWPAIPTTMHRWSWFVAALRRVA